MSSATPTRRLGERHGGGLAGSATVPPTVCFLALLMFSPSLWAQRTDRQTGQQNDQEQAPMHTNRLIDETSPYLLQHAHNPVDWYPWGDAAFEKARKENKLVLVSIGYSACHWCHVMEHESFEDDSVAAVMNEHFVSIKVDREERPDIDQFYITAVQLMNQ